jgi:hypothetical protein
VNAQVDCSLEHPRSVDLACLPLDLNHRDPIMKTDLE